MASQEQAWKTAEDECKLENDDDYDGGGDDGMAMMIVIIEKDKDGLWQRCLCKFVGRPVACKTALVSCHQNLKIHDISVRNNSLTSLKSQNRISSWAVVFSSSANLLFQIWNLVTKGIHLHSQSLNPWKSDGTFGSTKCTNVFFGFMHSMFFGPSSAKFCEVITKSW